MTRAEAVIDLATKLTALSDEAAELGVSIPNSVHGVDRATFDAIPGTDDYFPPTEDRKNAFWSKTSAGIVYFTREEPRVASVREAYGQPRERAF